MNKSEAIHRAALRKHRHKGNYIATHEALLAEAEYLQHVEAEQKSRLQFMPGVMLLGVIVGLVIAGFIKGWFA